MLAAAVALHFKRRQRTRVFVIMFEGKSLATFASGDTVRFERIVRKRSNGRESLTGTRITSPCVWRDWGFACVIEICLREAWLAGKHGGQPKRLRVRAGLPANA